ncbi:MAG: rhodanese-related sulfurtransferase [Verrucomicrobiota bacterium]
MAEERYLVAALYHFAAFPQYRQWRDYLMQACQQHDICGSLLLADEGINGTIAGKPEGVRALLAFIREEEAFADLEHKESWCASAPFHRLKVKLKQEIVSLGRAEADPLQCVGEYVEPKDWNVLISDPDVLLVDTRNQYEIEVGRFKGAVDPQTANFRQFPDYVQQELSGQKQRKIAMYCTGGIRCEKATALLRQQGFERVYHLKGGILKYLEQVAPEDSLWEGECFVFDDRVSLDHGLQKGSWELCFGCQMPLSPQDRQSQYYRPGVYCHRCHDILTPERLASLEERQRQVQLAKARGIRHVGSPGS